jgi:hypothetical protein
MQILYSDSESLKMNPNSKSATWFAALREEKSRANPQTTQRRILAIKFA